MPNHTSPGTPHDFSYDLARELALPENVSRDDLNGISYQISFSATSRLGTFVEAELPGIGAALERRAVLTALENVALTLGSPSIADVEHVARHGACLKHSPEQVNEFLQKLHEFNVDFGAAELRRAGITSITNDTIAGARTVEDYAALLPRLGRREDNPYVALLTRAACIDNATNEEWPTVEHANASRTIDDNPIAQKHLPGWTRVETAETIPCPLALRAVTLRPKHFPDSIETI